VPRQDTVARVNRSIWAPQSVPRRVLATDSSQQATECVFRALRYHRGRGLTGSERRRSPANRRFKLFDGDSRAACCRLQSAPGLIWRRRRRYFGSNGGGRCGWSGWSNVRTGARVTFVAASMRFGIHQRVMVSSANLASLAIGAAGGADWLRRPSMNPPAVSPTTNESGSPKHFVRTRPTPSEQTPTGQELRVGHRSSRIRTRSNTVRKRYTGPTRRG
jgi:hypothetical protein